MVFTFTTSTKGKIAWLFFVLYHSVFYKVVILFSFRNWKSLTRLAAISGIVAIFICLWGVKIYRESALLEPAHSIGSINDNPNSLNEGRQSTHSFNTIKSNKALISASRFLFIIVIVMPSYAPKPILNYLRPEPTTLFAAIFDMPTIFGVGFLFPFAFYFCNQEARVYVKRLISDIY